MRELTEIRKDIDAVDRQISELFEKRLEYTKEVADLEREIWFLDGKIALLE